MKLNYSLSREDYLIFQLYNAFHSSYGKKVATRNWLIVPMLYTLIAAVLFFISPPLYWIAFFVLAVLWLIFYPSFQKRRYKKVYQAYNDEYFKKRFDKPAEVSFSKAYVNLKDYAGEAKIKLSEIESMTEIKTHHFLKFTTGIMLVIPKMKIEKPQKVKEFLEKLAKKLGIDYKLDLEWK